MSNPKLGLIGAGGLGREIRSLAERQYHFAGFYDDARQEAPWLGPLMAVEPAADIAFILAIGNPQTKKQVAGKLAGKNLSYANLVSQYSRVSPGALQGRGIVVCDGVVATVNCRFGHHVLLNLNATVGHDVVLGDYCSVMPGANISGSVTVGEATLIGSGAIVLQGLTLGANVRVGAGAVVTKDVPDNTTVVGVPARQM